MNNIIICRQFLLKGYMQTDIFDHFHWLNAPIASSQPVFQSALVIKYQFSRSWLCSLLPNTWFIHEIEQCNLCIHFHE